MTQAGAKKHAEVIVAFCAGETIQWKDPADGEWYDDDKPSFGEQYEYRKKPEPRVAREWMMDVETETVSRITPDYALPEGFIRVREVLTGEEGV